MGAYKNKQAVKSLLLIGVAAGCQCSDIYFLDKLVYT